MLSTCEIQDCGGTDDGTTNIYKVSIQPWKFFGVAFPPLLLLKYWWEILNKLKDIAVIYRHCLEYIMRSTLTLLDLNSDNWLSALFVWTARAAVSVSVSGFIRRRTTTTSMMVEANRHSRQRYRHMDIVGGNTNGQNGNGQLIRMKDISPNLYEGSYDSTCKCFILQMLTMFLPCIVFLKDI